MGIDLKIKRSILKDTKLNTTALRKRALIQLENIDYQIINQTDKIINFSSDNEKGLLVSRMESFSKIDDGQIEIEVVGKNKTIKLNYYMSVIGEALIIVLSLLGGFILDKFILIFSALILIQFMIRLIVLKTVAENLLVTILSKENAE
jgi:hypothetical protein